MPAVLGCGAGDGLAGGGTEAASGLELHSGIEGPFEAVSISIQITRNCGFLHLRGIARVNKACAWDQSFPNMQDDPSRELPRIWNCTAFVAAGHIRMTV
jgi:hypothetical protein